MLMPIIEPLPILTKNCGYLKRTWTWLTVARKWKLKEQWSYKLKNGIEIVIPSGFIFNGASVPRIFWWFLSPTGLLLIPGLIHDYGYAFDKIYFKNKNGLVEIFIENAGRKYWDKLFLDVSNEINGITFINNIAWSAVRLCGFMVWKKHRKNNLIQSKKGKMI